MKAREIMTFSPEVVLPDDTVAQAARVMHELNVGAMPVVEDREGMRLVGIVTDRDLVIRHVAEGDQRLTGIIALADVSREVGPRDPAAVVRVLSDISEPATDRSPAPIG